MTARQLNVGNRAAAQPPAEAIRASHSSHKEPGFWTVVGVTYQDAIVIYRVITGDIRAARRFLRGLKEELNAISIKRNTDCRERRLICFSVCVTTRLDALRLEAIVPYSQTMPSGE